MDRIEYVSLDVLIMYLMNEFSGYKNFKVTTPLEGNFWTNKIIIEGTKRPPINNEDMLNFYAKCSRKEK